MCQVVFQETSMENVYYIGMLNVAAQRKQTELAIDCPDFLLIIFSRPRLSTFSNNSVQSVPASQAWNMFIMIRW